MFLFLFCFFQKKLKKNVEPEEDCDDQKEDNLEEKCQQGVENFEENE